MPLSVPPVPMPAQKTSNSPPVCCQISGPAREVVGLGVGGVVVLVRVEAVRRLARDAQRDLVVAPRVVRLDRRGADHDPRAERAQVADLLLAHLVGHHEDALVSAQRGEQSERRAGVAARRLDDRAARLEAVLLGVAEHVRREAVLVAPAGVQVLALHVDLDREAARDLVQLHDGRVADGLADVLERALHHGAPGYVGPAPLARRVRQPPQVAMAASMRPLFAPSRRNEWKRSGSCLVQPGDVLDPPVRRARAPAAAPAPRPAGRRTPCPSTRAPRSRSASPTSRPTSKQHAPMHGPIAATKPASAEELDPRAHDPADDAAPARVDRRHVPAGLVRHEHRDAVGHAHAHRDAPPRAPTTASASCPARLAREHRPRPVHLLDLDDASGSRARREARRRARPGWEMRGENPRARSMSERNSGIGDG